MEFRRVLFRSWLRVSFEENDGEGIGCPEVVLDYEEGLRDQRADLELLLDKTSRYWSHFCGFAAPWFVNSGVTHLEMVVPILEPGHPYFGDSLERSEERRVGNECVRTCRSRCSP